MSDVRASRALLSFSFWENNRGEKSDEHSTKGGESTEGFMLKPSIKQGFFAGSEPILAEVAVDG